MKRGRERVRAGRRGRARGLLVALSLLLSLSPTLFLFGGAARAQEGAARSLSREERVKVFEQVWRAVNEDYYDRNFQGVDWIGARATFRPRAESAPDNSAFYRILRQMVGELGDAHTRVYAPEEGYDRERPGGMSVGVSVRRVEGRPAVVWVEPGSEAARQGIRPGFTVEDVEGLPTEEALSRAAAEVGRSSTAAARDLLSFERLFKGPPGTSVRLTFGDEEGRARTLALPRLFREFPRRILARRLPREIGYLELTGFAPEIEREFDRAMEDLRGARALVLDLRNNGGGFVRSVAHVASHFFAEETDLGQFITRQGRSAHRRTRRLRAAYTGPVVVLVSARSASGAEVLAAALQEARRGAVVGTAPTTCGCLLGVSHTRRLADGGQLNVSDTEYRTARGRRVEGAGIRPDRIIELRRADLLEGRDRALEEVVERLGRAGPDAHVSGTD